MNSIPKLRASAGAEWLLGAFALLKRAPLALGTLGALFGALAVAASRAMQTQSAVGLAMQLLLMLAGPLLIAGMIFAAREVDAGRSANPAHLLRGVQEGKVGRLLATLLPQIGAGLLCMLLLVLMLGPAQLQQMLAIATQLEGQASPDPALMQQLPLGRLGLWLLLALVIGVLASFFTFTAIPQLMFGETGALAAMRQSFRACLRNWPAMLVFFVLMLLVALALNMGVLLIAAIVRLFAGAAAMQIVAQLLLLAILMPIVTGAMYHAWKQLHADAAPALPPAATGFEA